MKKLLLSLAILFTASCGYAEDEEEIIVDGDLVNMEFTEFTYKAKIYCEKDLVGTAVTKRDDYNCFWDTALYCENTECNKRPFIQLCWLKNANECMTDFLKCFRRNSKKFEECRTAYDEAGE